MNYRKLRLDLNPRQFWGQRGDWGRDLTLVIARRLCGMTLKALGEAADGMSSVAVNMALRRMTGRLQDKENLQQAYRRIIKRVECIV